MTCAIIRSTMRRSCTLLLLVFLLALPSPLPAQSPVLPAHRETSAQKHWRVSRSKELTKRIGALLDEGEAARAFWGISILSLESGQPLYEINADRLFTPASNTKLFTTIAAMALLGPDYRFRTTVESAAPPDAEGRLHGDIVLVGRGDPNLSGRVLPYSQRTERLAPHLKPLEELADQVVARGVKAVEGDVVGDDSYFADQRYGEGWSQDDLMWSDGAPASALSVNDNVVFLSVFPGKSVGEKATVIFEPDVSYYEVDNRITTAPVGEKRSIGLDRQPGSRVLTMWGAMPLDDTGYSEGLSVEEPAAYAAAAFRAMLERRGIVISGRQRAQHTSTASLPLSALNVETAVPQARGNGSDGGPTVPAALPARNVLAERISSPLIEDLRVVNKVSQNLHAETTLRSLGRQRTGLPSLEAALAAERAIFDQAGIGRDEYVLFDGSGMSRQNLVTPHAVIRLLAFAAAASWAETFRSTLPVSGIDGTLSDRLRGSTTLGRVQAKTGTLGHVNALSGYTETQSGHPLAFAIFCNNHKLGPDGGRRVIDQIVKWMVEDQPPTPRRRRKR